MAQCTVCTYFCHFWLSKLVSRNSELPCQYDLCKSSAIVNIAKVREDDDKETAFRGCKENLFEQVKIVKFGQNCEIMPALQICKAGIISQQFRTLESKCGIGWMG